MSQQVATWDPLKYVNEVPSPQSILRVKKDIADFHANPPEGILISPEQDDVTKVHALILGPTGTPYEGGFFQFFMKFPQDYPISPPRVRMVTTDAGRVSFNPNLYACGKVCLSILGTWPGPAWSPAQGLESVLISIQSLMNENPYHNEPAFFMNEKSPGDSGRYNDFVKHETIRVAVCGMVQGALRDNPECPRLFRERILKSFAESYTKYEDIIKKNLHLTGTAMLHLCVYKEAFQYETLLTELKELNEKVKNKFEASADQENH
ncbi:hypothetical protein V5799_026362 [Amblyomma americanum]|uniref:Ubiquitin-conjugating enzyme E2 Z n=1 Tax=Amblyomma americanum TaxID=6943 RepID=A0AAQ4DIT2_AMBAM